MRSPIICWMMISATLMMMTFFHRNYAFKKTPPDGEIITKQWSRSSIVRQANGTFVYQKLVACENSIMVLKCRNGTAVKVLLALYGRMDNKTCLKWNHQQQANLAKTTQMPYILPSKPSSNTTGNVTTNEYRPCYRNETAQLRRQCLADPTTRDECVIFVDRNYQFSEPVCPVPAGYRDPLAGHSRYAVVEFACFLRNNETGNQTIYTEPDGYVMEKGSERMTQQLAFRVLSKAGIMAFNQAICNKQQKAEQERQKNEGTQQSLLLNNEDQLILAKRASAKSVIGKTQSCVSLDGVRLKNIRHLISLKRKSNCNDIYIIGGTEVKNNDHTISKSQQQLDEPGPGKKSKKRTHQNGYRLDIAASDPSSKSYKAGNAGMCVSSYIRKNLQRLSPTTTSNNTAALTERQRQQIVSWKQQQKHVFNDTSESGGVIYMFIAKPVPLWDILYP